MSKRPHFSTARSTIIRISECLLTSTLTTFDSLPAARILSAFFSAIATSMSAMSTLAPSSASRLAVAPPIPWAPPVTIATLPSSLPMGSSLSSNSRPLYR